MNLLQSVEIGIKNGLSSSEVEKRIEEGKSNINESLTTRPLSQIFKSNIVTLFNFVNIVLAVLVAMTGQWKNMLFMGVIIINICIGIIQEIRSKRITDSLAILTSSHTKVMRDSTLQEIAIEEIVIDDIIKLSRGEQIPADCIVVDGNCQVNESLLTGESDLITKKVGDNLMSGSFINSGVVFAKVIHVGKDNYASKITAEAKKNKALNSEIMRSLNAIIKYVSIILFPIGALLFSKSFFHDKIDFSSSVLSTVSALVGMIPEGLILLTSTVLAVAVVRLSKSNVLVQQLYCIETLARVDTICLDKTGTITTGNMLLKDIVALDNNDQDNVNTILKSLVASDPDKNETALAIERYYADKPSIKTLSATEIVPFMSETKWSGASFLNSGSYVLGATQFVLKKNSEVFENLKCQLEELSRECRVLLVAKVGSLIANDKDNSIVEIGGEIEPIAFVCIADEIRASSKDTFAYFTSQGVELKVISGDDPVTVSSIAKKVGIPNAEKFIDATKLDTKEKIADAIEKYSVFGRVKPEQKKEFVLALQKNNKCVAMTGDGVNDVMALKASDCSVAMASGSDAARNVSHLVLVDNDFAHMPEVVAEGRRSINNLQRSGSLFLVKTIMSLTLGLFFVFLPWQYPFTPIQMTLFSGICIGLPSFVLALEPNHDIVRGHFLVNCITRSIPGGLCASLSILAINIIGYESLALNYNQVATLCLTALCFLGIMLIIRLSIPYTKLRLILTLIVIFGICAGILLMPKLFDIAHYTLEMSLTIAIVCCINLFAYNLLYNALQNWQEKSIENEANGQKTDLLTRIFKKYF